jgi:hypothetical protein
LIRRACLIAGSAIADNSVSDRQRWDCAVASKVFKLAKEFGIPAFNGFA